MRATQPQPPLQLGLRTTRSAERRPSMAILSDLVLGHLRRIVKARHTPIAQIDWEMSNMLVWSDARWALLEDRRRRVHPGSTADRAARVIGRYVGFYFCCKSL